MGYIKKLKNNELVGGTDKTTIYPVTSTEAVFEETTEGGESNFKSQKFLNNNITGDRINKETITNNNIAKGTLSEDRLDTALKTKIQEGYDTSWKFKGEYDKWATYDAHDVVYDPATNSSYISLQADNQWHPVNPEDESYVEGWWQVIMDGKVSTDANNALVEYIENDLTQHVTDAISDANGAIQDMRSDTLEAYTEAEQLAQQITDWSSSEISSTPSYTDQHPLSNRASSAQVGYFECGTSSTTQASNQIKAITAGGYALPTSGGAVKIKMYAANTYTPTTNNPVKLQFNADATTLKELRYNGEAVSPNNTWDAGEVISVYYDGSVYQASNAQGGGGKAEKIKYDNSQSGLAAENVQEAVDELADNLSFKQIPYDGQKNCALMGTQVSKWSYDRNYVRTHRVVQVHGEKYIKVVANNEYAPGIGFLKTYTQPTANNQSADFCDGYTATVRTGIGETQVLSIPSDCNYIVINCIYRASGIDWNYEPIYVGLSVDAQEVYDEVETIDRDGLASGSLILDSIDYGYYYSDANGSKTSFQTANIDKYKIKGIVSQIHLTARIGSAMYSLFKDIEGNILGSFAGAFGQGMNFNQDITLPSGTAFIEISHSTTYNVYVYVLDRMVDAVIDLAAPANGLLQLTSTNEGHYISSPTGTISELDSFNIDYYNIVGSVTSIHIKIRIGRSAYILFYDQSDNIIQYIKGPDSSVVGINFDEDITVPSNCARIAVSYSTTVSHTIEVKKSLAEQIKEQETEVDYLKGKLVDFRGKKIGLLGDSIAANGGFITKACQLLGATFKNAAIGGWFLGNKESKAIYKQINKISPATTQLDGDEDLIVIFAGTNDFGHSFTIGEPYVTDANGHRSYNTDASTTCGGLALAIQTLYTKYDGYIPIVICTPLQRSLAGTSSNGGSWDKNSINKYMDDYIDAIISVATYYGIPVCDFYHCNMNPNIPAANTLYFADGLHPNAAGHSVMGQILANYLVNNAFTLS